MATPRNPQRARELLKLQADRIPWLRGSGPNPFEYDRWQARTEELVDAIFGQDSPEAERYYEAVGIRGRLAGVRGLAENMSLNIHGQWGILSRLERAEKVLHEFDAELAQAA